MKPNFAYYNVVDQIFHAEWSAAKLARLELLRHSIASLWPHGHPTRLIHVVGTGGKGSTCRFIEMGLGLAGKAGSFMSPHLFDYRERFSIGGEFVKQEDIQWAWEERVRPHCVSLSLNRSEHTHTFHEVSILIALSLFERHDVKWAAMEAGIGGRYDQTRALDVEAAALTNVGSDHANLLGDELWQRVLDKAGAARPGRPFFTTETNPDSLEIVASVCRDVGAQLHVVGEAEVSAFISELEVHGVDVEAESLLHAPYQKWNAALAAAVIRQVEPGIDKESLLRAFAAARLLGRFWKVEEGVFADIAHNYDKIHALTAEIRQQFGDAGKILILGMSGKRLPARVFGQLAAMAKTIIVTGASYKGLDPGKVAADITPLMGDTPTLVVADPRHALEAARAMRQPGDVILLTGSTYMIEQALNPDTFLRTLGASFGWRMAQPTDVAGTLELQLPPPPPPIR
jgi:dihydrofolate synthase / folylpolyglutamate synthase